MSRVGQQPVAIPAGVTVRVQGDSVSARGPVGELTQSMPPGIRAETADGKVVLSRSADTHEAKSYHGLARTIVANMVEGVAKGYRKDLAIQGVGFKAALQGRKLSISLGFSSPVEYEVPEGIKITVEAGTSIVVAGADKRLVGDVAARLRGYFPAEPYKGKGVQYKGERVRRKVGKTVA